MTECFRCGHDPDEVAGCDASRTIQFHTGEELTPVPHGKEQNFSSYEELIEEMERYREMGMFSDEMEATLETAKREWDAERYTAELRCYDCKAKLGEYHHPGCQSEECPRCGECYKICLCGTQEKKRL